MLIDNSRYSIISSKINEEPAGFLPDLMAECLASAGGIFPTFPPFINLGKSKIFTLEVRDNQTDVTVFGTGNSFEEAHMNALRQLGVAIA